MNKKLVALAIVVLFIGYLGYKVGRMVTDMADSLDRTHITDIAK